MAIKLTTTADLDFTALQNWINDTESKARVRLTSLVGMKVEDLAFNAHVYELVADSNLPSSKLFIIPTGIANNDPKVKEWLNKNPSHEIRSDEKVYLSVDDSPTLTGIAVVR